MRLDVFPSASGDCVLVTSNDGKRLLADAGLPHAYDDFIAAPLAELRKQHHAIDVAYVSHIDRDHIGGILRMLDHEMKWRVFKHMQAKGQTRLKEPKVPRPPDIREIWHNAFLEDIAKTEAVPLGSALVASANALSVLNAATLSDPHKANLAAKAEMLALSVGDAIEVNWRIGAEQLRIPLNPAFGGKLMLAPAPPILLGSLKITVLGPTEDELEVLRSDWKKWLAKSAAQVERLRTQHRRDAEDLRSGLTPAEIARATQDMVLGIEKDLTPPNLASLVLLVEENGKRILLTGDAGDESLLKYLDAAGLMDAAGRIEVDVLKVPHHGAHNSFSPEFAERIRAANYIFCGDGEHHNPEPDVVAGYLKAVQARPPATGTRFWFNWSAAHATAEHLRLWRDIEAKFDSGSLPANIARRSLQVGEAQLELQLG